MTVASESDTIMNGFLPSFASKWPEDLHVMLLSSDKERILMVEEDGKWELPFFHYLELKSRQGEIQGWCEDVEDWFASLPEGAFFTGVVELRGEFYSYSKAYPSKIALTNLLMMEVQGTERVEDAGLPAYAVWIHATNIKSMIGKLGECSTSKKMLDIVLRFTKPCFDPLSAIPDPRYQPRWFRRASDFLIETASSDGSEVLDRVYQTQLSFSSTLLTVNTSSGKYFLKSPSLGCPEILVTAEVAKLFPEDSPDLMACNDSLNCFVSKGFDHISPDEEDIRDVVLKLGHLQLETISAVDKLTEAGVPVLEGLEKYVNHWTKGVEDWEYITGRKDVAKLVSVVAGMCRRLEEFKIPLVLAHGDAAQSNATFNPPESRNVLFFDWEFGHIGHPFCDLHRLRKYASKEVLDEYLQLWSAYIDEDEAWEALELACDLGWVVKVWSLTDRMKACDPQLRSSLEAWASTLMQTVRWFLTDLSD